MQVGDRASHGSFSNNSQVAYEREPDPVQAAAGRFLQSDKLQKSRASAISQTADYR